MKRIIVLSAFLLKVLFSSAQKSNIEELKTSIQKFEILKNRVVETATIFPDSAVKFGNDLLKLAKKSNSDEKIADALSSLTLAKIWASDLTEAKQLNDKAFNINTKLAREIELANNYYLYGKIYQLKADYVNSNRNFFTSNSIAEKNKLFSLMQKNHRSMAINYLHEQNNSKIFENAYKALQIEKLHPNEIDRADDFSTLTSCYIYLNKVDSVEFYFKKAYNLFQKNNMGFRMGSLLSEKSLLYEETGPLKSIELEKEAQLFFDKIAPLNSLASGNKGNIAEGYFMIAQNDSLLGQLKNRNLPKSKNELLKEAEQMLKESIAISKSPPVHAMACLKVYHTEKTKTGIGDAPFLKKAFHKLSLNFTWWVNRKDINGNNIFEGGFLGLDNIGVFDRSATLPENGHLEQADGTAWMAMYCLNMLEMALELTSHDDAYEDMAIKFFEHFVYIAESLNKMSNDPTIMAWDENEGFFYDVLSLPNGRSIPIKVRSLVGLSTLFAVLPLQINKHLIATNFIERLQNFTNYRAKQNIFHVAEEYDNNKMLLSLIPKERLARLLDAMLDENEFLSPFGIRSLSKIHENGYQVTINNKEYGIDYEPAESTTGLFGGNSNWRGPIWMPMNYMIINALRKYYEHYGDDFKLSFPSRSGNLMNLNEIADQISFRLISVFQKNSDNERPIHAHEPIYKNNADFQELILFYEYFHGDTGRGVGASHQTGWTGLVAELINQVYKK